MLPRRKAEPRVVLDGIRGARRARVPARRLAADGLRHLDPHRGYRGADPAGRPDPVRPEDGDARGLRRGADDGERRRPRPRRSGVRVERRRARDRPGPRRRRRARLGDDPLLERPRHRLERPLPVRGADLPAGRRRADRASPPRNRSRPGSGRRSPTSPPAPTGWPATSTTTSTSPPTPPAQIWRIPNVGGAAGEYCSLAELDPLGPSSVAFGRGHERFKRQHLYVATFGGDVIQLKNVR